MLAPELPAAARLGVAVGGFLDPSARILGEKLQDLPEQTIAVNLDAAVMPGVLSRLEQDSSGATVRRLTCAGCDALLAVGKPGMPINP